MQAMCAIKKIKSLIIFTVLICSFSAQASNSQDSSEIPYFSSLTFDPVLNAQKAYQVEDARSFTSMGPYLVEIPTKIFFGLIPSGVKLRGHYYQAVDENGKPMIPKALVLGVHGLQSNGRWFNRTATTLAQQGISVMIYDRRGSGLSDGNKTILERLFGFLGYKDNFDPNPEELKLVEGKRGHAQTGRLLLRRLVLNPAYQLEADIKTSFKKLVSMNENYPESENIGVHILANCFGSRIALPFAANNSRVKSMIITAPSTDMQPTAEIKSLYKKVDILVPWLHVLGPRDYIATPLKDEDFVPKSNPAYDSIANNSVSLSLRFGTGDFFYATNKITGRAEKAVSQMKIPMLVVLGDSDKIVNNEAIRNRFVSQYQGLGKILKFRSPHMIEFSDAATSFAKATSNWILASEAGYDPTSVSDSGLAQLISSEKFGLAKKKK